MHNYEQFQDIVWDYYRKHGRDLPWRRPEPDGSFDPYKIMVSEIMLQQTQVARVIPKYAEFLNKFPTIQSLAQAELGDVLRIWSGLGYNRRAKFLWQAAQTANDKLPNAVEELTKLPGIGPNTAAAIVVYALNQPRVFIETNIRSVYLHHFFADQSEVHDKELLPIVEATIDQEHPREWFWALMDYGVFIKSSVGNTAQNSKHYTKQSTFKGSRRQIRGQVLRLLMSGPLSSDELKNEIADERLESVLNDLVDEQLVQQDAHSFRLY